MSISENNLSRNGGGQSFRFWREPFAPEKIQIEELEQAALDSENEDASLGLEPSTEVIAAETPASSRATKGRKPTGLRKPSRAKEVQKPPPRIGQAPVKLKGYDHHEFELDLDRPQFELNPFQQRIYYKLHPIQNTIATEFSPYEKQHLKDSDGIHTMDITSSAVLGESGSGLTTMLSKKAYESYQNGRRPSIVLVHREHLLQKVAQTIIDLADKDKRKALLDSIEIVSGDMNLEKLDPTKKIYIVSQKKLELYLRPNENYKADLGPAMTMGAKTWRAKNGSHKKLADIFPLAKIRKIIVDEVDKYTGKSNQGRAKVLTSLVEETSKTPRKNPVHLFGTCIIDPRREEEEVRAASRAVRDKKENYSVEFADWFPLHSRKTSPSPRRLTQDFDHYKEISLSPLGVSDEVMNKILSSEAMSKDKLSSISPRSINAAALRKFKEQEEQNPGKKWHIIAHSDNHARALLKLFNASGVNAKALTSKINGQYVVDEESTEFITNDEGESVSLRFVKNTEASKVVIDEYESDKPGSCNVIIDLDAESCIHSTKTDKVLILDLVDDSDLRLKHYLGEAVRDAQGPSSQSIDYIFLRKSILDNFDKFLDSDSFSSRVIKKSSSNSSPARVSEAPELDVTLSITKVVGPKYNKTWFNNGLKQVLEEKYPTEENLELQLRKLATEFHESRYKSDRSIEELEKIITGVRKDKSIFRELIAFLESDLERVWLNEEIITHDIEFDVFSKASFLVPELIGVKNQATAELILAHQYQKLIFNEEYQPHTGWLKRLDGALAIRKEEEPELKRIKAFTELIAAKFGEEAFEDKGFIQEAIEVFTGSLPGQFTLFGLLVANLSSNYILEGGTGFSFDQIRREFEDLLGSIVRRPFEALQRDLIARYPDGPPKDRPLSEFFLDQLYDDSLHLDFDTLIDSVDIHSRATRQELIVRGTVEAEIQEFLEAVHQTKLNMDLPEGSPLRPSDEEFKAEIEAKAKANLSSFTREVLYNQIISKIWGQGRSTRLKTDEHAIDITADGLYLKDRVKQPLEEMLDDFRLNPTWLKSFDSLLNPNKNKVDIKPRLAAMLATFLAHRHSIRAAETNPQNSSEQRAREHILEEPDGLAEDKQAFRSRQASMYFETNPAKVFLKEELSEEQKREVQVLTGAIVPTALSLDDRNLLRDFANFYKLPLNTVLPANFEMLGVRNTLEARTVLQDQLSQINSPDQVWLENFGRPQERLSLLADFIFEDPSKMSWFRDSKSLAKKLKILSGDYSDLTEAEIEGAQDLNREFVAFANQNGLELKLEDLVVKNRNIIGLQTKEELFALLRQPDFVNWDKKSIDNPNHYMNRTAEGVEKFVSRLATKLDLPLDRLLSLADLNKPEDFYQEPVSTAIDYFSEKLEFNSQDAKDFQEARSTFLEEHRNSIMARELLIEAFPEEYKYQSEFIFPDAKERGPRLKVVISANRITFREQHLVPLKKQSDEEEWLDTDFTEFRFLNDTWVLHEQAEILSFQYSRVSKELEKTLFTERSQLDQAWLERLGLKLDSDEDLIRVGEFVKLVDSYIRSIVLKGAPLLRDEERVFTCYVDTCLGKTNVLKNNPQGQKVFRDFVDFINNRPAKIGKEDEQVSELGFGPIDVDEVIKESPKLTGVQNMGELKSVIDYNFKTATDFREEVLTRCSDPKTRDYLDLISDFTNTNIVTLLSFEGIEEEFANYRQGINKLTLPDFVRQNFDHDNEFKMDLKGAILTRQLLPEANPVSFSLWTTSGEAPGGKDVVIQLVFTDNKVQLDIIHKIEEEPQGIVMHQTLDWNEDSKSWDKTSLYENQLKTRFSFVSLVKNYSTDGLGALDDISRDLIDAYNGLLCHKQEHDFMYSKVTNLMTKFIEYDDPKFFEQDESVIKTALERKILALLGHAGYVDREFLNKFIDFADIEQIGFAELRNDPSSSFRGIFTLDEDDRIVSEAKRSIDYIRSDIGQDEAFKIYKESASPSKALEKLVTKAKAGLGFPTYCVESVSRELGVPGDMKAHMQEGIGILLDVFDKEDLGFPKAAFDEFKEKVKASILDTRVHEDRALNALKRLFPDLNFDSEASGSGRDLITIRDSDGDNILKSNDKEFFIEYDGKDLHLLSKTISGSNYDKVYTVKSSPGAEWLDEASDTSKSRLTNEQAMAFLAETYPQVSKPGTLSKLCAQHNIDYDELIASLDIDSYIANTEGLFPSVKNQYPDIARDFNSQFMGRIKIMPDIMLCKKIWSSIDARSLALVDIDTIKPGQNYFTLERGNGLGYKKRSKNKATPENIAKDKLLLKFVIDPKTGQHSVRIVSRED